MTRPRRLAAGLTAAALVLAWSAAAEAALRCQAEVDRTEVARGGQIVLTVTAVGELASAPQHDPPRIDGVQVITGGTSQSFRVVNGDASLEIAVTYYLQVRRGADFEIPAIAFRAGGERCDTEPIAISVVAAPPPSVSGNRTAPPGSPRGAAEPDGGPAAGSPGDPSFIVMEVDKDEVWLGEQVVLVFRYFRYRANWDQPSYSAPRTEGFWRIDLPPERNYRRSIRGHVYDVTEIRYALFPTRVGDLVIEPATLTLAGDPFDRLFGRGRGGPRRLQTEPIAIRVRPLPVPQPRDFSGLVASQLDFTATVDRDTVPRGEPVNLTLAVQGDAFLKSYEGLALPPSDAVQVHDAAESLREHTEDSPRYRATYRQEKAVVPLEEGTLRLPAPQLVYFDTDRQQYVTARAELPDLVVVPSDLPALGDDPSGFRRTEIARLADDLAFVHTAGGSLRRVQPPLAAQPLWWAALLAPWALLGFYRLALGRRAAAARDPLGQRRRRALPRARQALRALARDGEADTLARVVAACVADLAGRPAAGLTAAEVRSWAAEVGEADAGRRLAAILAACDGARFGGGVDLDVGALAAEASDLLEPLARAAERRPAPRGQKTPSVLTLLLALGLALNASEAVAAGAGPGVDPTRLLAEGNQAYTEGDLQAARRLYREALDAGVDDPVLHYNLANVHARAGELGRAIAGYLRALRLDPSDADIRTNLQWVRSHTRDLELAGGGLPPVVAQLDAAAHVLSLDEWSTALVALAWLVAGLLAWGWRRGWLGPWPRRLLLGLGAGLLLVAVVVATRWYEERVVDTAVVIVEEAEVRSGPATTFPVVFRVHDGLTLAIRGERDGWARIGLGGDWVGWMPTGALERVRQTKPAPSQGR